MYDPHSKKAQYQKDLYFLYKPILSNILMKLSELFQLTCGSVGGVSHTGSCGISSACLGSEPVRIIQLQQIHPAADVCLKVTLSQSSAGMV